MYLVKYFILVLFLGGSLPLSAGKEDKRLLFDWETYSSQQNGDELADGADVYEGEHLWRLDDLFAIGSNPRMAFEEDVEEFAYANHYILSEFYREVPEIFYNFEEILKAAYELQSYAESQHSKYEKDEELAEGVIQYLVEKEKSLKLNEAEISGLFSYYWSLQVNYRNHSVGYYQDALKSVLPELDDLSYSEKIIGDLVKDMMYQVESIIYNTSTTRNRLSFLKIEIPNLLKIIGRLIKVLQVTLEYDYEYLTYLEENPGSRQVPEDNESITQELLKGHSDYKPGKSVNLDQFFTLNREAAINFQDLEKISQAYSQESLCSKALH